MKQSATLPQLLRPELAAGTPAVQYRAAWIANLPKKKNPDHLLCVWFSFLLFSLLGPSLSVLFFFVFVSVSFLRFFLFVCFFCVSLLVLSLLFSCFLVGLFVLLSFFLFVCLFLVCLVTITDVSFGSKHSKITYGFRLQRAYGFIYKSPCTILPDATQSLAAPIFGDI